MCEEGEYEGHKTSEPNVRKARITGKICVYNEAGLSDVEDKVGYALAKLVGAKSALFHNNAGYHHNKQYRDVDNQINNVHNFSVKFISYEIF